MFPTRHYASIAILLLIAAQLLVEAVPAAVAMALALVIAALFSKKPAIISLSAISVAIALYRSSMAACNSLVGDPGIPPQIIERLITLSCFLAPLALFFALGKERPSFLRLGSADRRTVLIFCGSCLATVIGFSPFMRFEPSLLLFSVLFALVNASLEEVVWRGFILSLLGKQFSLSAAMAISSLLFGLSHHMLGFSLPICLLFALGGFLFSVITRVTRGILCSSVIHFIANVCMGLTGILFGAA